MTISRTTATQTQTQLQTGDNQATHDVFHVVERDGGRPQWNRIGLSYLDDEGRQMVVLKLDAHLGTGRLTRVLELREIDRAKRPIPPLREPRLFPRHELFEEDELTEKRVGVAFVNRDSSLSLVIDDGSRDASKQRYQMRRVKARAARAA
jgi:hypothetical protein